MIIVQWSMTERIREQHIYKLIGDDLALRQEYEKLRFAALKTDFWKTQIAMTLKEPLLAKALALVVRVQNLNSKRDDIVHRIWGGGLQGGSLGAEELPTTDAVLLKTREELQDGRLTKRPDTLRWKLTFDELRNIALAMATLNRDLWVTL